MTDDGITRYLAKTADAALASVLVDIEKQEPWAIDQSELGEHLKHLAQVVSDPNNVESMLKTKKTTDSLCVVLALINVRPRYRILDLISNTSGLANSAIETLLETEGPDLRTEARDLLRAFFVELTRRYKLKKLFSIERLNRVLTVTNKIAAKKATG